MHLSLPKQFPLFILASSVCWSLQCLISALTQGGKGGHLFRLTCSVVLWGGRNTANKHHSCVWGVLIVYGPHWVSPSSPRHVLTRSTLLRLQVALQGNCPKQTLCFTHFPGLSCSGSGLGYSTRAQTWLGVRFVPFPGLNISGHQVLGECTVPGAPFILIAYLVLAPWLPRCTERAATQVCHVSPLGV